MKPTKTEEAQVAKWFKEVFWPAYPSSFCRSGKGSRAKAMVSMLKYNPDKAEQGRIIGNLKAQVRADKANPDRIYWSIGLTYVNNRMWDDEIESAMEAKERQALATCNVQGCNHEVHGSMFKQCAFHVAGKESHIEKMRQAWVRTGIDFKSPNLIEECRNHCKERMAILTGKRG